ncbi:hypothetical protein [Pontixanthobacter sp.]|uniref:hypothetical protein n=1 Tax=Pontixanthobacter sp. TaxID=2792078 RepID=UPI003C7DA7A8
MDLSTALERAKTEEDVKDAYIKALGLKGVFKGLVDIQTPEIWFEAKESPTPPLLMFAQLLTYVRAARKRGEPIPGFLCVIDREKAALMATEHALPLLEDKSIVWPKSGSAADKVMAAQIAPTIETHFILYQIDGYEAEFIKAARDAVREGRIIRTPITPNNLRQVFDKWVAMVGHELGVKNEADYAVLFFADIMHDGTNEAMRNLPARLLFSGDKPVFIIGSEQYELASERGYRNFWNIYHRPPEQKHRHYLLERRDSLLPMDDQKFKGAFYTPLHIVDKAYDQLNATLGADWQSKYIVWDMCAGVGNLEAKHSNLRNVYMSTLDQEDVTIMRSNPAFAGAEIFQYDYLNDDVTDFGEIDYALSGKLPQALRQAIADAREGKKGAKPILVLINPPYAEATNDNTAKGVASDGSGAKENVAKTRLAVSLKADYGKATNELFAQFVARIDLELPMAVLAMFSTLKYVISPTLEHFRTTWQAKFMAGFVVHSRAFDSVPGNFPIAFLVWDTSVNLAVADIETRVLDKDGQEEGEKKFVTSTGQKLLTKWIVRPRSNREQVVPLKNALTTATATKDLRGTRWSDDAIAYMWCNSNDLQQANKTALFSSGFNGGHGLFVTEENLWQAAIVFAVRRLIKPTWLNDRDQFLQPSAPLSDIFKSDCLVWMLFNGSNLTAGADGLHWNDRDWSLTNHFIPFTESEVGAERFESDFMVRYMADMDFSPEAQAVLDEGRTLFRTFHATRFPNKIREEFKLGRADAGWYQVRRALEAYGDIELIDFDPFKAAYAALTEKLRPMVFELGFLPE